MKKLFLIAIVALLGSGAMAQSKYGATPEDSVKCVQNISLYQEFFKQKNYKDAVGPWRKIVKICPEFSKGIYQNGAKMYKAFIKENKDNEEVKNALVDTLMLIYDWRMQYFDKEGCNRGNALSRKGADLLKYKKKTEFEAAYNMLKESHELCGDKMPAAGVASYYSSAYRMYAKKKMEKGELIALFPTLAAICEKNIKENEKKAKYYQSALGNIEKIFSQIAECPDLVELYTPKHEADPDNLEQNKQIMTLLEKKECFDVDLYLTVVEKVHNAEPSAKSAMGLGNMYIGKKDYSTAKKFYLQAAELAAEEPELKEQALFKAAQCAYNMKSFSEVRSLCNKVLAINAKNGSAIILIGDAYASTSKSCGESACEKAGGYWAAYDKYARAKSVDPSVADKANQKMANAKGNFPAKTDCFFVNMNNGDPYTVGCWINESTTVRTRD